MSYIEFLPLPDVFTKSPVKTERKGYRDTVMDDVDTFL